MAGDIESNFANFSLVDEGEEGLVFNVERVPEATVDLELYFVSRFLTDKTIRNHIMKERMAGIWHPGKRLSIRELDSWKYIFQFYHKLDLHKVFSGGPGLLISIFSSYKG